MKSLVFIVLLFLCITAQSQSQQNRTLGMHDTDYRFGASALDMKRYVNEQRRVILYDSLNPRSAIWVPLVEIVGLNLLIGGYDAYIADEHWAKTSFASIKESFNRGFLWDGDSFLTNLFAHPFHGAMYYNFAWSSGYEFWASLGMATFGSWQWESFMETEPPAYNDWIMTTIGGSMLGEITYRLTSEIIDERSTGFERVLREVGAGILNPGRAFNRIIKGRVSRTTDIHIYEHKRSHGNVAVGMNNVADSTSYSNRNANLMLTLDYTYGDPFSLGKHKPFDFFRIQTGFNFGTQDFIGFIDSYGLLHGKEYSVKNGRKVLTGLFLHYDYNSNSIYRIGGTSVGGGLILKLPKTHGAEVQTSTHLAVLLMGGANSAYAEDAAVPHVEYRRDYNLGMGGLGKFEGFLTFDYAELYIGYYLYWISTMHGAKGNEYVGIIKPKLRFIPSPKYYIGFEYLFYYRFGRYNDYPDVDARNDEYRIFIAYRF